MKWPNDIILFGKKICGILCESKITGSGCTTVSGIGVNLTQNPDFFKSAGVPHGASIKMLTGKIPEPEKVIAEVLNTFEEIYISATKSEENRKRFFEEYSASCITIGREIKAQSADGEIRGRAVSVNEDGTLNVEVNGEIVRLIASEVSVRGIMGYV
ncbi:MAG TPA: biotin--[acetyl-CoA-carboxylase] ligase [Ruminiclostridium sp.]|nr:biotin--[acetyl-CoA-carboxylase] ligase [Ruminiclostridium sp.]